MNKFSKKNFRKSISVIAAIGMIMGMLSACGEQEKSKAESTGSEEIKAEIQVTEDEKKISGTIDFYYWDDGQTDGVKEVITLFNKQYPNVEIVATLIPRGEYETKLKTSLPSGTGPDVFWMNADYPDYVDANLLYDLTELIERDGVDMSVFPQFTLDMYSIDGHYYGMPKDYDGIGLFYNKAIFDELGLEYPKDNMTWDQLLELAKKATNENHYGYIVQNAGNICYQDFIYSNGGRISSADNIGCEINEQPAVEAIEFLHDMVYKHKVSPTLMDLQEMKAVDMFCADRAAMITAGSWSLKTFVEALGDNLGICTMPVAKTPAITTNGLAYFISESTDNLEASWEFVKFLATEEAQKATASGAIPAYKGCDEKWAEMYSQYDAAKLLEGAYYEGSLNNPWWSKERTQAKLLVTDAMTNILSDGDADIQGILDKCDSDIEALTK